MRKANFGRNIVLNAQHFYHPESEDAVLAILNEHQGQQIRCVGRLHSWSPVIEGDTVLLDLRQLRGVEVMQRDGRKVVRVGAGCQIKSLLAEIERQGLTLPSVGFITEQTIAGAISTGTHGSGRHSLSHYVVAVRVACYDPATKKAVIREFNSGDELRAARCSLGTLGVILSVTMECRPQYNVEEHFREYESVEDILKAEESFPLTQFYSVPWRWRYFAQHRREVDAKKSTSVKLYHWYRFIVFDVLMHLVILATVRVIRWHAVTKALFAHGVPNSVIRNWRVIGESSSQLVMEHELFRHVEIELFVQKEHLADALVHLKQTLIAADSRNAELPQSYLDQVAKSQCSESLNGIRGAYCHHYPICIRKILPDDTLISMASPSAHEADGKTCDEPNSAWYSITLTNYHRGQARKPFDELATFLAKSMFRLFNARVHWGKLCPFSVDELRECYPGFEKFRSIQRKVDHDCVFTNTWTQELLQ